MLFSGSSYAFKDHADHATHSSFLKRCPQVPEVTNPRSLAELQSELSANKIEVLEGNTVSPANVERFLREYKKFPEPLKQEMIERGARIRLMEGTGVGIDPSLLATTTTEGTRQWIDVPGSGGEVSRHHNIPTRIAINHLYEKHGASNLFLHEHAHTLDSLYGVHGVSKSQPWKNLMAIEPKSTSFVMAICGQYCLDREEERFAELFSYYFACEATKEHMRQEVPAIAKFFDNLTSIDDLLNGRPQRAVAVGEQECDTFPDKKVTKSLQPLLDVSDYVNKNISKIKSFDSSVSGSGMK